MANAIAMKIMILSLLGLLISRKSFQFRLAKRYNFRRFDNAPARLVGKAHCVTAEACGKLLVTALRFQFLDGGNAEDGRHDECSDDDDQFDTP